MKIVSRRTLFYGLIVLLLTAALVFFAFAPIIAGKSMNRVEADKGAPIREETLALHRRLLIADLHADSLLWQRDLLQRGTWGHVDVPRLSEGNVALQVFTTVTKSPDGLNNLRNAATSRDNITLIALAQRWPSATWQSLTARALHQGKRLEGFIEQAPERLRLIRNKNDLEQLLNQRENGSKIIGAVLGTEGSHALDGDIGNVQKLFDAGFRMMSLQHFFDNRLGGSLHGLDKTGLTEFGVRVVREIEALSIMLDVSHSSPQVVNDVLAIAQRPLIVSHTGVQSHCATPRNISDQLLARIASAGGLIGIGFWDSAACDITPSGIAKSVKAAINVVGIDHVALGSDFDGAVTTGFDAADLVQLTQALVDAGLDELSIRKVMGENQVRFFLKYLPE